MTELADLKIVSLLPSATEIIDCLGLTSALVGCSHECDYPPSVTQDQCDVCAVNVAEVEKAIRQRY